MHTGQNYDYELNEIFFERLGIRKPDVFFGGAGTHSAETIGDVIIKSDELIKEVNPDAYCFMVIQIVVCRLSRQNEKVPIFHMEAGNRCFDQRVPEEVNRKVIDHLSDINMPLSEHARRYLIAEGIPPETIIKVGSNMKEVLAINRSSIDNSDVLQRLGLKEKEYFVLSAHREENVDSEKNFNDLIESIDTICETYKYRIIFSVHPRTQKLIDEKNIKLHKLVRTMKPLGFADYNRLQKSAFCVISDSGTITEDLHYLGSRQLL